MPEDRNQRLCVLLRAAYMLSFLLALASQAAPLTEAEKQLLQTGISKEMATAYGRAGDAAGLASIINLGDPSLVQAFDIGMRLANMSVLPPAVEALVIANFDHPKVGTQLRGFQPRYQTRRLFDLHYARIEAAYKTDDPSFAQILNTDIAGIEEPLLQVANKFPSPMHDANRAVLFLGRRKYPRAVPLLIAALPESYRASEFRNPRAYNLVLHTLMDYPSVEVWRRTRDAIDGFHRAGQMTDEIHAAAGSELDALLNDPDKALAQKKRQEQTAVYNGKRDAILPGPKQISALKTSDPGRYASEYAGYLAKLEPLAAESGDEFIAYDVGADYFQLGMFARFRLRDPAQALALFARSGQLRYALGQIAVADTYQFEMRDNAKAAQAYQLALDEARKPTQPGALRSYGLAGTSVNVWYRGWLAQEIEYLKTGKPFSGGIGEAEIGGFFLAARGNMRTVAGTFESDVPMVTLPSPGFAGGPGVSLEMARDWSQIEGALARADRAALASRLAGLPASRLTLLATIEQWSALPDAEAILRYFDRHDPSGYWSTCLFGTVLFLEQKGEAGRTEALRNGSAQLLPGLAAPGKPNALATAAGRFMRTRGFHVQPKSAPGQ